MFQFIKRRKHILISSILTEANFESKPTTTFFEANLNINRLKTSEYDVVFGNVRYSTQCIVGKRNKISNLVCLTPSCIIRANA